MHHIKLISWLSPRSTTSSKAKKQSSVTESRKVNHKLKLHKQRHKRQVVFDKMVTTHTGNNQLCLSQLSQQLLLFSPHYDHESWPLDKKQQQKKTPVGFVIGLIEATISEFVRLFLQKKIISCLLSAFCGMESHQVACLH